MADRKKCNYHLIFTLMVLLVCCDNAKNKMTGPVEPEIMVSSIAITPRSVVKTEGSIVQFTALVKDTDGIALEGISLKWHSSENSVALIDSLGTALCKQAGDVVITAHYDTIESNASKLLIVTPAVYAGQTSGNGIVYTNETPGIWIGQRELDIDINKDGVEDFKVGHTGWDGNNADMITYIEPLEGNRINISSAYKSVADSILNSNVDTEPWYDDFKYKDRSNAWVDTVGYWVVIDHTLEWMTKPAVFSYFYERDAYMWNWNFGLCQPDSEKLIGLMLVNAEDVTYGWLKIQVGRCSGGISIKEYAGIRLGEQ